MSGTHPPPPSEPQQPASGRSAAHPARAGEREISFLFEQQDRRIGGALGASVLSHAAFIALVLLIAYLVPERVYQQPPPDRLSDQIVWLAEPGPGGGGGGGGNESPEPPAPAELPGEQEITVPVVQPPEPEPEPAEPEPEPEPVPQLSIPARTLAAATDTSPGVLESTQAANVSQGVGRGGGADTGVGGGIGPGEGQGLGPGTDRGAGGGAFRPGSGVESPQLLVRVQPEYTSDAMRARVQGLARLDCVVLSTGSVGECSVVRSVDANNFGLDDQAIRAAKQWRFVPGTRLGEPVAVHVYIEMEFSIR